MDEIDNAEREEQRHRERALSKISTEPEVLATGFCLNCDETLDYRRWCDADYRDDWEKRIKNE